MSYSRLLKKDEPCPGAACNAPYIRFIAQNVAFDASYKLFGESSVLTKMFRDLEINTVPSQKPNLDPECPLTRRAKITLTGKSLLLNTSPMPIPFASFYFETLLQCLCAEESFEEMKKLSVQEIAELLRIADYFDMPDLAQSLSRALDNAMNGLTPEEICKIFKIQNNYRPGEIKQKPVFLQYIVLTAKEACSAATEVFQMHDEALWTFGLENPDGKS